MNKIHLYFVPGLAANSKIYENLSFPEDKFELHFLEWFLPLAANESLENYAHRMSEMVLHKKNVVLIGTSFGGILVQEMAKFIDVEKIIIISSVKSHKELPKRLRFTKKSKLYKLFPTKIIENIEDYVKYFYGKTLKKRADLYKIYLSIRNPLYLHWAIHHLLHWKQKEYPKNLIHIHGTEDKIFPIKNIKHCIKVEKGTHVMVLTKAKKISKIIIEKTLT